MTLAEPRLRRFNRDEYHKMADSGFFENQRVELIDGEIIEMAPQHEPHARMIMQLIETFAPQLKSPFKLRCQMPLAIGNSEPEPGIAVVTLPLPKDTAPSTAALVIEVAGSSLAADRKKSHLYASAQIPEYWIINLAERSIERYENPTHDPAAPFSARYAAVARPHPQDAITPAALPTLVLKITDLFPPA